MTRVATILVVACLLGGCQGAAVGDPGPERQEKSAAGHMAEPPREGGLAERGQATADGENRGVFSEQSNLGRHDVSESKAELVGGQSKANPGSTPTTPPGAGTPAAAGPEAAGSKPGEAKSEAKTEPKNDAKGEAKTEPKNDAKGEAKPAPKTTP